MTGEISWKVFFGCVGNDWIGNSHLQVWNIDLSKRHMVVAR